MKLLNDSAEIFIPDGTTTSDAFSRVTHLGIGAHQDDLEFMAFHGITECYQQDDQWFGGVTCTNGAGSARCGSYQEFTDAKMMQLRRQEQNEAATIGHYSVMAQLDYPSSTVKNTTDHSLKNDLHQILTASRPKVVYTHNPADKHDTHIAVLIATIHAIRELPLESRPQHTIGCEVWRDLDWLPDGDKVIMDVSNHAELASKLNGVFDSQISGGKRYDLAILGRRSANATFFNSHATDGATQLIFGMELTPLIQDESQNIAGYVSDLIEKFRHDVVQKLKTNS